MDLQKLASEPMAIGGYIGLGIGLFFCFLLFVSRFKVAREVSRYRRMLDEKNKMEKEHMELYRRDLNRLEQENATASETNVNLRGKLSELKKLSETVQARDVEIVARAEKRLLTTSPNFTAAWEEAKNAVALELEEEEAGKRKSKSFFRRFTPSRNGTVKESVGA